MIFPRLLISLLLIAGFGAATQRAAAAGIPTLNDESTTGMHCLALYNRGYRQNGFYVIEPKAGEKIVAYCMHTVSYRGLRGGWTLVWGNLSSHETKPHRDLRYNASIYTKPLYEGATQHSAGMSVADFQVYVGLDYWRRISATGNGGRGEILYEWTPGPGAGSRSPIVRSGCRFSLDPANWRITFFNIDSDCRGIQLNNTPNTTFFQSHNNRVWSAIDADNDAWVGNCSSFYGSPFWHISCWSGSISGYGPRSGDYSLYHGAHWIGAYNSFGNITTGQGSGDGWLYVR